MKGLIIKDFYSIKKVMSMYVILTVLLMVYCIVRNRYEFIPAIPILIFSTTITSTFSMDAAVEWNRLAVTMVEKRKDIVKCKYILFLLIILFGGLCSAVLITPSIIIREINVRATIEIVLLILSIAFCSGSISLGILHFSTTTIEKIELGDTHNSGKTVAIVYFETFRLVYKPHSLTGDYIFEQILQWINCNANIRLDLKNVKALSLNTRGWEEYIEQRSCNSIEDIRRYYYRMCLCHGLYGNIEIIREINKILKNQNIINEQLILPKLPVLKKIEDIYLGYNKKFYTDTFMTGLSGILYSLLREEIDLPSILLLGV